MSHTRFHTDLTYVRHAMRDARGQLGRTIAVAEPSGSYMVELDRQLSKFLGVSLMMGIILLLSATQSLFE